MHISELSDISLGWINKLIQESPNCCELMISNCSLFVDFDFPNRICIFVLNVEVDFLIPSLLSILA